VPETPFIGDCWNKIGVWGKADCPELEKHVHCRNCPVYSAAATQMLSSAAPSQYAEEWTELVAGERETEKQNANSAMIFRIGVEWLALSIKMFQEVAESKAIHTFPHRRKGLILGVVNIRGELLVCVSLAQALGLDKAPEVNRKGKGGVHHRLLVVSDESKRLVFPVDQVGGIHRFNPDDVKEVPATLAGTAAVHTSGILSWQNKSAGLLDDQLLFYTLNKGLS
jgi:chemotaxis-related protein WspD